jgi:hypothetical protein
LTAIAHRYGTTVADILSHPKNADLAKACPNPEILAPLDVVIVPVPDPKWIELKTGQTNEFVSDPPKVELNVILRDAEGHPLSGKAVSVEPSVGDDPLSTDGDGLLTLQVSILCRRLDVTVTESGTRFTIWIGNLDPHSTDSGTLSRLRHMGHVGSEGRLGAGRAELEAIDRQTVSLAAAVRSFQLTAENDETGVLDDNLRAQIRDAHAS